MTDIKFLKHLLPLAVSVALFACCDEKTDPVVPNKKPVLTLAEQIAKYKDIKEYVEEYAPGMTVGLGLDAGLYINDPVYKTVADRNFQIFTMGNAMKHSSVARPNGKLDFGTIDAFTALVPRDIDLYGHNFLWHTQQQQQYLKSLIAPSAQGGGSSSGQFDNVVSNSGFEQGTDGWSGFWGKFTYALEQPGRDGSGKAIRFTIGSDCVNMWDAQLFWTLNDYLVKGETYCYEFYARSDSGLTCQFLGQNADYDGIYKDMFTPGNDWTYFCGEFTLGENELADIERIGLQFGGEPGSKIWFDDFRFGKKNAQAASARSVNKTPEEKKEILLGAMESWIRQMAEHMGDRVVAWDVINEPIADGSNAWRGINNVFNGQDKAPVEGSSLNLNWASDHWYWGYYIGKEYAVKAFEYARKYCAPGAKLYVNDYNLEISPGKLDAIIAFANYIDSNNSTGAPLVDGLGTQMHVNVSVRKEQVDEMFRVMAATGKLVRITELDVAIGTEHPTLQQLNAQANTYKMIVRSYMENVPEAQRSGITLWTLSDAPGEHLYWLKGDSPNLFDANYVRKEAYKYFCDGIAGRNLAEDFN